MSGERYVPNGVILICTHGASIGFFQVTFHLDTSIYASNMGTEGDRWPILNISSFGACIATPNVPCFPSPVIWQQPREGIYINNNQMLLENSTAKCMRGGTVSIRFTFANLQESPSGSFKRPSEYIKDGFDWVFGKLDDNLADVRAGLADIGAPVWLQNGIDQLAWNAKMSVGIVEGALNGVVGLGELIWDVATDPIGVGGAIVDGVCDGAKSAWEWGSKGDNWTKAANDSWEWASDGDNWTKAAKDADQWLNDNPRVVGNVTGEVLLEVGAAALTGGSSLGASAVKKGGKELVEESLEYGTKKLLKEGGEEIAEQRLKKNLPEVITKEKVPYDDLGKIEPCFLLGTLISTISGLKPIELIDKDDTVIAFNFATCTFVAKNVVNTFKNWAKAYFKINMDSGELIKATGRHMFWVESEQKWEIARKLNIGDILKTQNGVASVVDVIRIDNVELDTFNLEIQDYHNYLVGINGILVHNKSKPSKFDTTMTKGIKIYEVFDPQTGETVYIGQTDKPDIKDRFKEHCYEGKKKGNHKKDWKNKYDIREVKRGNWTPYEASVWEQHYIEKNGGKGKLQNNRNEITEKKYDKYKGKHNPCK